MLQEVKELQNKAVTELYNKVEKQNTITFRAPTGSGKTFMMADYMNRVLSNNPNIIFLVSTLSKGGLAEQNYRSFVDNKNNGQFPNLRPYLINTETSKEESLFIPTDCNVYILPRDLYKKTGILYRGSFEKFLQNITDGFFGQNKTIYCIKDECHQATNNLDSVSGKYFKKIINFSATPNLKRRQSIDVEISDEDAMNAKLIKRIEYGDENDTVEMAINKFKEIKTSYRDLLAVNPCLIIQISNKEKAEEEYQNIQQILNKTENQDLKWMYIVDDNKKCDTNDNVKKRLSVERWKDYAKSNVATIDIIIFKMVISEGWDIPRACMLYQVRDVKSKQLSEQVIGRVRRNPRLLDFETLSPTAQDLCLTSWVWGKIPEGGKKNIEVELFNKGKEVTNQIQLKTIRLKSLTQRKDFDLAKFLQQKKKPIATDDIFSLYNKLKNSDIGIQGLCSTYANNFEKWFDFANNLFAINKEYNSFVCNYKDSMEIEKDTDGNEKLVSFPISTHYLDNGNSDDLQTWVWLRKDKKENFSFDSEAERKWARILNDLSNKNKVQTIENEDNTLFNDTKEDKPRYLWGKNFLPFSNIRYEYYDNGIHSSYPDFILKDKKGDIHIFEVKSVNFSASLFIDEDEYDQKVLSLRECYKHCSHLLPYFFYLPVLRNDVWQITRFYNGNETTISKDEFIKSLQ